MNDQLNDPPYVITDVFTDMVEQLSAVIQPKIGMPVFSYYGYITELNQVLIEYSEAASTADKKFPLIWLAEPFTITNDGKQPTIFGTCKELTMFIITDSTVDDRAPQRKAKTFKPILYPIRAELFRQMNARPEFFGYDSKQAFELTDRYYWGEDQKSVLNDIVDTLVVKFRDIKIQNNTNCVVELDNTRVRRIPTKF